MRQFNIQKFRKDLIELRGSESQSQFAPKLGINRSTLSFLENGKQLPTFDVLSRVCDMENVAVDEYFSDTPKDSLVYLMGSLDEVDKEKIEEMAERIRIKEKYELLAKRANHGIH